MTIVASKGRIKGESWMIRKFFVFKLHSGRLGPGRGH